MIYTEPILATGLIHKGQPRVHTWVQDEESGHWFRLCNRHDRSICHPDDTLSDKKRPACVRCAKIEKGFRIEPSDVSDHLVARYPYSMTRTMLCRRFPVLRRSDMFTAYMLSLIEDGWVLRAYTPYGVKWFSSFKAIEKAGVEKLRM